jgi:hypothetical protein
MAFGSTYFSLLSTFRTKKIKKSGGEPKHDVPTIWSPPCDPGPSKKVPLRLHLPPLDPKSEEFPKLFRSFLSEGAGANLMGLSDEDARLLIEIIDEVRFSRTFFDTCSLISSPDTKAFRVARLETEVRHLAFTVLRRLCGRIGHLPESYLLSEELKFSGSGLPRASGGFADVRMGVFKRKNVAVKSLRISESDNKAKIRKVGDQATSSHLGSLVYRIALLQRSFHVEELVPSQCSRSYRRS